MNRKIIAFALAGVSAWAIAATAYSYRARESAIRGWNDSIIAAAERDQLREILAASQSAQRQEAEKSKRLLKEVSERAEAENVRAEKTSTALRDLWGVLANDPEIADDLDFAIAVANQLHQRIELGPEETKGRPTRRMSRAMLHQTERSYCGDFSVFLRANLMAAGIPARTVQLATKRFVSGDIVGDTHVTVEALIDNRWTMVDATFNATFSCSITGELVGVDSARQCVKDGGDIIVNHHQDTRPGRTVEEHEMTYNLRFSDFLDYTVHAATMVDGREVPSYAYPDDDWLKNAIAKYRSTPTASTSN